MGCMALASMHAAIAAPTPSLIATVLRVVHSAPDARVVAVGACETLVKAGLEIGRARAR